MATTLKSIVTRGAKRLDAEEPGWAYRVHIRDLPKGRSRNGRRLTELWTEAIRTRRGRSGTRGKG